MRAHHIELQYATTDLKQIITGGNYGIFFLGKSKLPLKIRTLTPNYLFISNKWFIKVITEIYKKTIVNYEKLLTIKVLTKTKMAKSDYSKTKATNTIYLFLNGLNN